MFKNKRIVVFTLRFLGCVSFLIAINRDFKRFRLSLYRKANFTSESHEKDNYFIFPDASFHPADDYLLNLEGSVDERGSDFLPYNTRFDLIVF